MGFKCGIIGLPNVGKSTLFNALTETNRAEAANYPFATIKPNIGRVPVFDERLNVISKINDSRNTIPTFMDFIDIAGLVKGASNGEGLGNKFLGQIREMDALAHVVRCFDDKNISHQSSTIDPIRDIETIETELKLTDIEVLMNKSDSLKKKSKDGNKETINQLKTIDIILEKLNNNKDIKSELWNLEQFNFINSFNLISSKPVLYVCNVDEHSVVNGNDHSNMVKKKCIKEGSKFVLVSAEIESQIAQYKNKEEKQNILKALKLNETTLNKLITSGYNLLNLITFFTSGKKESRAWTIIKNSKAPNAAGKIHSDFEKGFIRAETISYNDFINYQGEVGCREAGKLRQEGKNYQVQDGDIFNFLFNV